jgi:hypothetical protein
MARTGRRPGPTPATLRIAWERDVKRGSGCWFWAGPVASNGYGRISWQGRRLYAHRVAYELLVAPLGNDLVIDHLCRTPLCVNPAHMEPVTIAENTRRGVAPNIIRNLLKVCIRGHKQVGDNVYTSPSGRRNCVACQRIRYQQQKAAKVS